MIEHTIRTVLHIMIEHTIRTLLHIMIEHSIRTLLHIMIEHSITNIIAYYDSAFHYDSKTKVSFMKIVPLDTFEFDINNDSAVFVTFHFSIRPRKIG